MVAFICTIFYLKSLRPLGMDPQPRRREEKPIWISEIITLFYRECSLHVLKREPLCLFSFVTILTTGTLSQRCRWTGRKHSKNRLMRKRNGTSTAKSDFRKVFLALQHLKILNLLEVDTDLHLSKQNTSNSTDGSKWHYYHPTRL